MVYKGRLKGRWWDIGGEAPKTFFDKLPQSLVYCLIFRYFTGYTNDSLVLTVLDSATLCIFVNVNLLQIISEGCGKGFKSWLNGIITCCQEVEVWHHVHT